MERKGKSAKDAKRTKQAKRQIRVKWYEIPFVKPARVGIYKVWRTKKELGKGKDKVEIDQINISTLDESWQIKIPATFDMYGMICGLYEQMCTAKVKDGAANADKREGQLTNIFGNMLYASCIANGYFQQAIQLCATLYANPDLLKEGDENHARVMKDVKALVEGFLEWRENYETVVASHAPTAEEMQQDQVADEMLDELGRPEETTEDNGDRA